MPEAVQDAGVDLSFSLSQLSFSAWLEEEHASDCQVGTRDCSFHSILDQMG